MIFKRLVLQVSYNFKKKMMEKKRYERPIIKRLESNMPNKFGSKTEYAPKTHIDGVSVAELTEKFGSPVFVLSERTIRENIRYGKLGASEEELIEASKNANIYEFIVNLPKGFDTLVGERGVKLSGGQKQRISIARIFLKKLSWIQNLTRW